MFSGFEDPPAAEPVAGAEDEPEDAVAVSDDDAVDESDDGEEPVDFVEELLHAATLVKVTAARIAADTRVAGIVVLPFDR